MLAFIVKFVLPLVVCLACLACPVERILRLDEFMCEDEAKQVCMAASVTIVMLLQQQIPAKSRVGGARSPAAETPQTCC
jgi:hypothetical protein